MAHQNNIAITGSEGFVGRHLVSHLAKRDVEITSFDRKKYDLLRPETLIPFVEKKDTVIHLAANHSSSVTDLFSTNVMGTISLIEAIKQYGSHPHLIFASSAQAYLANSLFGLSKKTAEELLSYYARKGIYTLTILRLSNIYGPYGRPDYNSVISTYAHRIMQNKPVTVSGDGSQKRDFIYVSDVVDAITQSVFKPADSVRTIDICTGRMTSLHELLEMFEMILNKKIRVEHVHQTSIEKFPTIQPEYAYNILKWQPAISLEQGLRSVLKQVHEKNYKETDRS